MNEDFDDFTIDPENWKLIESALRVTGTLNITTAFNRLNELYRDESTAGLFAKKTNKMGPTYEAFIKFYLANDDLCRTLQLVIDSCHITYDEVDGAVWAEEFQSKKGNSPTAMKTLGTALKELAKALSTGGFIGPKKEKIIVIKTEWVSPFKSKVTEEGEFNVDEQNVFELSLQALSRGEFDCLDPVSGDASCEMRVPFLLDVRDCLSKGSGEPVTLINNICPFSDLSRGGGKMQRRSASRYFGLCYPLTIMRRQAKDKFLFLIDDVPSKFCYSFNIREALKSDLAEYNVDYMRSLAAFYAKSVQKESGPLCMESMISNMFNICQIDMSKGGQTQPLLPIFTAMRLILMHELRCNRPIAITISRIGYAKDKYTHVTGYKHCGSKVLFYRPKGDKFVYVPEDELEEDEKLAGLTNIHTFNMFRLDGTVPLWCTEKELFFFSPDWNTFLEGFTSCDITHLLRVWAAAHPPVPKASRLWRDKDDQSYKDVGSHVTSPQKVTITNHEGALLSEFEIEEYIDLDSYNVLRGEAIRSYIEDCHLLACPGLDELRGSYKLPPLSLCGEGIPLLDLTSEAMDLSTEYQYYKAIAKERDLYEAHYAEEFAPEESFYELDKGSGWVIVPKSKYDKNTNQPEHKKVPSRVTTVKRFQRICGNLAFSPVHVFLSSFNQEKKLLSTIGEDWIAGHMTLTFIEEEVAGKGNSFWKVDEYKLDKFDPDIDD